MTVLETLREQFPDARQMTLRRMLEDGRVRVNGFVVRRAKDVVPERARFTVVETLKRPEPAKPNLQPMHLVHEDDDLLVIDKPAGLLTSTGPREKRPTAVAIIKRYLDATSPTAKVGVVHRLDRDASGLLVFAKTDAALRSLKSQFFKHSVKREYLAITHGTPTPKDDRIDTRLVEHADGTVHATERIDKGERAITDYQTIERTRGIAAVRVRLLTGRKHQIRVHLAGRGVPIVGDTVYGKPDDDAPRLMLSAVTLGFSHPATGKPVEFTRAVPKPFPLLGGKRLHS